ncbi:CDK5 and ABL1 enzyme substrate 2 [Smittium mucronatum]|uniref:CDK5 and ABL1 enzyme substrate 2 n=1 Tax=Smittium mucronatum TaxID=133383 RepID=A0A1R0GSS7_9FUNG|nr:CDK5 and ABL1 enzyme substrate 2 [Smittium mucronatum]
MREKRNRKRLENAVVLRQLKADKDTFFDLSENFQKSPSITTDKSPVLPNTDSLDPFFRAQPDNQQEQEINNKLVVEKKIMQESDFRNKYTLLDLDKNPNSLLENTKFLSNSSPLNLAFLSTATTAEEKGSIMALVSINKYVDENNLALTGSSTKTRKKLHHLAREKFATMEFIKKEQSYAQFLKQSYSMDTRIPSHDEYDPNCIDDPHLDSGLVQRTMLGLTGLIGSIFQFTNTHSIENELNERFSEQHYSLQVHGLNISQIRNTKAVLYNTSRLLRLEKSTLALAVVYYEKLLLLFEKSVFSQKDSIERKAVSKGEDHSEFFPILSESRLGVDDVLAIGGTVVNGFNLLASICLVLASKINEPSPVVLIGPLISALAKGFLVNKKSIYENEFFAFSLLEFGLLVPSREYLPHLYRF